MNSGRRPARAAAAAAILTLLGCASAPPRADNRPEASAAAADDGRPAAAEFPPDPFPSTYVPLPSKTTLIRHAHVYTGAGDEIADGDVLMRDGKIAGVGRGLSAPEGAAVIDGTGKFVTPGIIDVHSHLGVYPSPQVEALADGNELTNPDTANVRAENSVWPQDEGFDTRARRRRDHARDPARIGKPHRRAFGRPQERALATPWRG